VGRDVRLTSLSREPVLHFLLIGLLLFVAYEWLTPTDKSGSRIVVTQPMVDSMAQEYRTRWSRPPSEQELVRLVDAYVRDEILYREGVAQGLDRDDPVVKRRVRQKLEVIAEEQLAREAPTDADLAAYLEKNAKGFTQPGTVTFEQIYFAAATPAAQVEAARAAALRGSNPALLGQATMLPPDAKNARLDLVARDFGLEFAAELEKLPLDSWAGPVSSAFGQHLVRVTARTAARIPPLADVRAAVAREWENERRTASLAENDKALRQRYEVIIDATLSPSAATR
jgi:hypothetical protein